MSGAPDAIARRPRCAVRFERWQRSFERFGETLSDAGWTKVRQAGSHETWRSPDGATSITVAGKDSDTVPVGTLGAMRRATGLEQLR
jgi:predicted RNA binding protein YcfA (HicA-like mRNA interferase family)